MESTVDLQVVLPVYNEEETIAAVIGPWCAQLDTLGMRYVVVAIDDGSKDKTGAALEALRQELGRKLEVVRQANAGHGPTILRGYRLAVERGVPWVFQADSDGQCDPQFFQQFWESREGHDMVVGCRERREDGAGRVLVSTVLRVVVWLMSGVNSRDVNVPYRLMRTAAIAPLVAKIPSNCFFTNVGLTVLARRAGLRFATIPIIFRARTGGKTTISYTKMGRHALNLYRNLSELLQK